MRGSLSRSPIMLFAPENFDNLGNGDKASFAHPGPASLSRLEKPLHYNFLWLPVIMLTYGDSKHAGLRTVYLHCAVTHVCTPIARHDKPLSFFPPLKEYHREFTTPL